jgi:sec-independent protein translocase protein TatC
MVQEDERLDLISHLEELRTRLIRVILYAVAGATAMWFFYQPIYSFLVRPLQEPVKKLGGELAVRGILEGLLIKCEVSLICGIVIAAPFIYREIWAFVAPGLTHDERRAVRLLGPISGLLLIAGVALGYLITGPSVRWLLLYVPPGAKALFTLNDTLLLVLKFYLAFGLSFQLPIVLVVLAQLGIVDARVLTRRWREAVIIIMVVAAVITPTWDPFTMTICAAPMVALYLGTIWVIKIMERRRRAAELAQQAREAPDQADELAG